MPNPDGTMTRNEHRRELIRRFMDHFLNGVDPDKALGLATAEHEEAIKIHWAQKTAETLRALGVKEQ